MARLMARASLRRSDTALTAGEAFDEAQVREDAVAGAPLTAFSAALTAMYLRTPSLHKPRSVWPTPAGIGISKDVWMLAIGLSLLADRAADNGTSS